MSTCCSAPVTSTGPNHHVGERVARCHLRVVARTACAGLGLAAPQEQTVPLDPVGAAAAVTTWRSSDEPITAVCAYNDEVALAVLAGLRTHGLVAPADMAVIGVDNIPTASLAAPPLTTIDFHPAAVGRYLAAIVLGELEDIPPPQDFLKDTLTVVVRESA